MDLITEEDSRTRKTFFDIHEVLFQKKTNIFSQKCVAITQVDLLSLDTSCMEDFTEGPRYFLLTPTHPEHPTKHTPASC